MKFKVPKNTLDKAIKSVSKAVPNKGIQPILNNILLENQNGHLTLNATDLDFSIEATIPSTNEENGRITISARKLEEIVSKLDEDDVYFSIDEGSNKANLLCKHSNFDLVGMSADDFPKIEKAETNSYLSISKEKFSRVINLVSFAASRYDVNNILGGVYFGIREIPDTSKISFEIAATDGNRLSSYEIEIDKTESNTSFVRKEVVVPIKVILDVQKILETSVDETIKISFLANQIVFFTQDRYVITRLLDGTYPRYKQLIPTDQDKFAQIDRKEFMSCLERIAVMANEITNLAKLDFKEGTLLINSSNNDYGKVDDTINIEYIGDPVTIYFNVKFLIEALKHMDSDRVQISISNPVRPAVFKPIGDDNYIHLIMPIKHEVK